MLEVIERELEYTHNMIGRDKFAARVMEAMAKVPRDEFIPQDLKFLAFNNGPVPIGHGQTISQPYIVALMTDLLEPRPEHVVLEVGTGSGYQTAVLSQLCKQIYSIELIADLSEAAITRFKKLGYNNIETRIGDGYQGWLEHAPYDGIIVTAAAAYIPEALKEQLKPGGRMVIPVGRPLMRQELMLLEKDRQGKIKITPILDVTFVPLVEASSAATSDEQD
ncbi:Protein-L-isoaspartate O-methyltransferase [hydrothermal vent metagenome]|uniref:protein-L-isoaspartate(D-aspartate) O-methyltransferase n=1 Tax=hydrothermal vent metagenome TaxID=652676 RepID=A0A3B1BM08_9ZZZZ